jgi:hypothetical protein
VPVGLMTARQPGHSQKNTHRSVGIVSTAAWPQVGHVTVTSRSAIQTTV